MDSMVERRVEMVGHELLAARERHEKIASQIRELEERQDALQRDIYVSMRIKSLSRQGFSAAAVAEDLRRDPAAYPLTEEAVKKRIARGKGVQKGGR